MRIETLMAEMDGVKGHFSSFILLHHNAEVTVSLWWRCYNRPQILTFALENVSIPF